MGILAWGPLGQGMLTGRVRRGQDNDVIRDRIDEIVPPGTDIGTLDQAYVPPAIQKTQLRRRPLSERSAA
jgi:aryl-alcohol dehydrogenase-like predicted oxidoreductase